MPVRMVNDEELENEDNGGEINIDELKKICEKAIGYEISDEWFDILVCATPALSVACADDILAAEELNALADTALWAGIGEDAYNELSEKDRNTQIEALGAVFSKIVEASGTDTPYGTLGEAMIDVAVAYVETEQEEVEDPEEQWVDAFIFYLLREVAVADEELSETEDEALQQMCDIFGYDYDELFEEYE